MKKLNPFSAIIFLLFLFNSCKKEPKQSFSNSEGVHQPLFEKISSNNSQITFSNLINENLNTDENLFNYDYFYNGAGVGVEDLNNDGLLDIVFTGNQVDNELYLNQGNFKFKNITSTSNLNKNKNWANGITFVDINEDGWKDIYISQGGPNDKLNRKNVLLINQKNNTFVDEADKYGLADTGISTQSVFFDIDNDGDLDCLVMNESELYGVDPITLNKIFEKNPDLIYQNSSHLYLQNDGDFIDITKQSGINQPIFGLGLTVSDFNLDGFLDFYIASDYYLPDALFINNQDGTFSNRIKDYTNQISFYGMGMDVADINNDLLQDIFVLDMAANDHIRSKTLMASMNTKKFDYLTKEADYHYQYMYNSLQLNIGNNQYSNIAHATGTASTDWSWSVLMQDFDHDEDKDIYITNGYRRYALDNDLQQKVYAAKLKYKNNVPIEIKKQLYESMPSEKLQNILYEQIDNLQFKESAKNWGLDDFSFSNGCAIGDFDNDGDLDLVVNNMDDAAYIYKNKTVETKSGNYLKIKFDDKLEDQHPIVQIKYGDKNQIQEIRRVRGYRSSHEPIAHFGLAETKIIDTLTINWPGGRTLVKTKISTNQTLLIDEEQTYFKSQNHNLQNHITLFNPLNSNVLGIDYAHKENIYEDFEKEILLPYKQSNLGPYSSIADVNNDGLDDILLGGASSQPTQLYLQTTEGKFKLTKQLDFENDRQFEDMASLFFDFDNDNDLDLYVVSGGNEFPEYSSLYTDRLYLNDGQGNFSRSEQNALNTNPQSGKVVKSIDFDSDGDNDLIVGNRIKPQNYPYPAKSKLYKNENGKLIDVTNKVIPDFENFGIVNDLIISDYNNDNALDIIAVGEWTDIGFFKNNNGIFIKDYPITNNNNPKGWYFSITETDINNDGLKDYIVGNVGENLKFSTSETKPFKVYGADFDDNGTPDIVLSKKYNGNYVPVRGRECSSQQMPFIQEKFKTYSDFANAKLVDIYGEKLENAYEASATTFKSMLLINTRNGFEIKSLPKEAQFNPINSTISIDLNKDGFNDLICAGNIYETEVETPRLDANSGTVLISNGKDGYSPLKKIKSGLYLNGNVKQISTLRTSKATFLISVQNNGPLELFSITKK